jgi:hypothetical protein
MVAGRHIVHPERHKRRNEPTAGELGNAPEWMSTLQAEAWDDFAAEAPWLNYSHRALVEIASTMRARFASGDECGVQALWLLRLCLGQMGMTPTDASKISWSPDEKDPDDDIFDGP